MTPRSKSTESTRRRLAGGSGAYVVTLGIVVQRGATDCPSLVRRMRRGMRGPRSLRGQSHRAGDGMVLYCLYNGIIPTV